uniref:CSON005070 protein n=1 Tax=Culicoides sonorensis TaxID=179676 RepID=A0A336MQ50_CULSO
MSSKLFMADMRVSCVELVKLPENVNPEYENCVLLRLFDNVEMEVCDHDLKTLIDHSNGIPRRNNCIFTLNHEQDVSQMKSSINVFKKDMKNRRIFLGRYDLNLENVFRKLLNENIPSQQMLSVHNTSDELKNDSSASLLRIPSHVKSSCRSLKSMSMHSIKNNLFEPKSETIKGLYPLLNNNQENVGFIVLTLTISYYGNVVTHPKESEPAKILFDRRASILVNNPEHHASNIRRNSSKRITIEVPTKSDDIQSINEKISEVFSPIPPPSRVESTIHAPETEEYDEYVQEINGNALIIRIAKGAGMKAEILEPGKDSCLKNVMTYSRDDENVTVQVPCNEMDPVINSYFTPNMCHVPCCKKFGSKRCSKLPIIRGNLKYPNKPSMTCDCNKNLNINIQDDCPLMTKKLQRNFCLQACEHDIRREHDKRTLHMSKVMEPSKISNINENEKGLNDENSNKECVKGIEVCQKGSFDPSKDVYLLKLGKKRHGNQIEIEMRTPKCMQLHRNHKNTLGVQVFEEEFEDYKATQVGKLSEKADKTLKRKTKGKKKKKGKDSNKKRIKFR